MELLRRQRKIWSGKRRRRSGWRRNGPSPQPLGSRRSTVTHLGRAQALVMAEYEEAFERPQYGVSAIKGSGFVRAGGEFPPYSHAVGDRDVDEVGAPAGPAFGMSRPFNPPAGPSRGPPTGPSRGPPTGPSAMAQGRYPPARPPSPPPSAAGPKAKGKRAMDSFLAEIKG